MKYLISILFLVFIIFSGCSDDDSGSTPGITPDENDSNDNTETNTKTTSYTLTGKFQDGRCLGGADVYIYSLVKTNLNQNGDKFQGITDSNGAYEIPAVINPSVNPHGEVFVEASCKNEITDEVMPEKTFRVIVDFTAGENNNANPPTTATVDRIRQLYNDDSLLTFNDFSASRSQAETEYMLMHGITGITTPFSNMSIEDDNDDGATLLAMNVIHLQGNNTVAEQSLFLTEMSEELVNNNGVASTTIKDKIKTKSTELSIETIKNNHKSQYEEIGIYINTPNFDRMIDSDGDGILGKDDDDTIDTASFTNVTGADISTSYQSNEIVISGLSEEGTTKVSGTAIKNGSEETNFRIENGDTISFIVTSSVYYSTEIISTITINDVEYSYSLKTKDDDRQQIILFDSGQPAVDGNFSASADGWCSTEGNTLGLSGTFAPFALIDSLVIEDANNPKKVTSINGDQVSDKWSTLFDDDQSTSSFEDMGIIDDDYWSMFMGNGGVSSWTCNDWTSSNSNDDGSYFYFGQTPFGTMSPADTCDQLKKILCVAY